MARIRALSRGNENKFIGGEISIDTICINPQKLEVTISENIITLSVKEMQLLELFARNKGQTLTKEQILNKVWGLDSEAELNNVELYIHYLRKKVPFSNTNFILKTIRGVGYCLFLLVPLLALLAMIQ